MIFTVSSSLLSQTHSPIHRCCQWLVLDTFEKFVSDDFTHAPAFSAFREFIRYTLNILISILSFYLLSEPYFLQQSDI
jgi:hypothetical protein